MLKVYDTSIATKMVIGIVLIAIPLMFINSVAATFILKEINKKEAQTKIQHELVRVAREVLNDFGEGEMTDLQYGIANMAFVPGVISCSLVDETGEVIFSTHSNWRGKTLKELLSFFTDDVLNQIKQQRKTIVHEDERSGHFLAYHPIDWSGANGVENPTAQKGALIIEYNPTAEGRFYSLGFQKLIILNVITLLICALSLFLLIRLQVEKPLADLRMSALKLSLSEYWEMEKEVFHLKELRELAETFSVIHSRSMSRLSALKENEEKYRSLFDFAQEGIWVVDTKGVTTMVNKSMAHMLEYEPEQMIGTHLFEHMDDKWIEICKSELSKREQGVSNILDFELVAKSGKRIYTTIATASLYDKKGHYAGAMAGVIDVTSRRDAQDTIHYQAYHDSLTDLANRRFLLESLHEAIFLASKQHVFGAILFVDLDQFKTVNDSLGHQVGDELLQEVAKRASGVIHSEDLLARIGGDEFVLLVRNLGSDREDAVGKLHYVANKLQAAIASPFKIKNQSFRISSSIGVSLFPHANSDCNDLLKQADAAMFRAKYEGRNRVVFFSDEMLEAALERLKLQNKIIVALENDDFELYFQPQFDSKKKVVGAETLLRWFDREEGAISPGKFIPLAEDSGLITEIDSWVMKKAFIKMREWLDLGLPDGFKRLSINVSSRQFMHEDFVAKLQDCMEVYLVPAQVIEFELTESLFIEQYELAISKMEHLRLKGFHFALDDFGTGYSSLSYLKRLPIDKLKIDQTFIYDMEENQRNRALVSGIVNLAESLGLNVIAEGVEEHQQVEYLKRYGCDLFQGFYFSKPLAHKEFERLFFFNSDSDSPVNQPQQS